MATESNISIIDKKDIEVLQNNNEGSNSILSIISRIADNPDVNIDLMKAMIALRNDDEDRRRAIDKEDKQEAARVAYFSAFTAMQGELPKVRRNKKNLHTKTNYADMHNIMEAITPILQKNGFAITSKEAEEENGNIKIETRLMHRQGYFEVVSMSAAPDTAGNKNAIQAKISAQTYCQRYNTCRLLGIVTGEDDDGQAAAPVRMITEVQQEQIKEKLMQANEKTREWFQGKYGTVTGVPSNHFNGLLASMDKAAAAAAKEAENEDS